MDGVKLRFLIAAAVFFSIPYNNAITYAQDKPETRNVILFIGDGMGLTQVYAAYTKNHGMLNLMRCPYTGFSMTCSASHYITDSGAGGTAISCGKKTYNGAIGMDKDTVPCKTILEYAEDKGIATGLIATSTITHATPASFIAHQKSREMVEAIASDFLKTDVDLFIGGGANHFAKRADNVDLIQQLKRKGYDVFLYPDTLDLKHSKKAAVFTAPEHNPSISDGRGNMLPDATEKAIEMLNRNHTGFFLMVEGSQIDWGGHNNDIDYVINEIIDMDKAVGKALAFAEKDSNTLVVITADHETGGLVILNGDYKAGKVDVRFNSSNHTGVMVPVYAYGPDAQHFSGIYENTDIFLKLMHYLNLGDTCYQALPK
jgi:alkaline phosphatase